MNVDLDPGEIRYLACQMQLRLAELRAGLPLLATAERTEMRRCTAIYAKLEHALRPCVMCRRGDHTRCDDEQ